MPRCASATIFCAAFPVNLEYKQTSIRAWSSAVSAGGLRSYLTVRGGISLKTKTTFYHNRMFLLKSLQGIQRRNSEFRLPGVADLYCGYSDLECTKGGAEPGYFESSGNRLSGRSKKNSPHPGLPCALVQWALYMPRATTVRGWRSSGAASHSGHSTYCGRWQLGYCAGHYNFINSYSRGGRIATRFVERDPFRHLITRLLLFLSQI